MKPLCHIFLILFLTISTIHAGKSEPRSLGLPFFTVITPAYPTDSKDRVRLDVIIKLPYEAIQFLRIEGGFKAMYEVYVSIQDENGSQLDEEIWVGTLFSEKFTETISSKEYHLEKISFFITPSKCDVIVKITDLDTRKSGRRKVVVDLTRFSNIVVLSDLLLIDEKKRREDPFSMGFPILPPRISDTDTLLTIYYEARISIGEYIMRAVFRTDDNEIVEKREFHRTSDNPVVIDHLMLEIGHILRNKVKVELELEQGVKTSSADIVIDIRWMGLTSHIYDIDDAIDQLVYIAERKQIKKMKKLKPEKKEKMFKDFWKAKDPSPGTTENELMDEYYRRVKYANDKFTTFQDGWRSDMGMIFILFGPPDNIEINLFAPDGKSYQWWQYYLINKTFVFVDPAGFGDYELLERYNLPY